MLAAIERAAECIYLEMYVFEDDNIGNDFIDTLARKAEQGVKVIMVIDAFGSSVSDVSFDRLRAAGGEVLYFSHWFRRTHRKILIIDEKDVFIGGVNIADRFGRWKDLQVFIASPTIARNVLSSFVKVYRECGGKDPGFAASSANGVFTEKRSWFYTHNIGSRKKALRKIYERHIAKAERSITLVTPYLVPHRWLIARIHAAILRGVKVELLVPKHTDHWYVDRANLHFLDLFTKAGARCYLTPEMNHAKAMLIDDREGTVGSQNLDALSFDWNAEAGVFFEEPDMVDDLKRIFDNWKAKAELFVPEKEEMRWYDPIVFLLLSLYRSVI